VTQRLPFPTALTIAGSDSGGGAGIQADIKTVTCLGGYAATAIAALTAQNTQGVFGIHEVPEDFIRQQMTLVLDDIGADAVKTGMLHSAGVIRAVAEVLARYAHIPLIVDPVMVAKGGAALLQAEAVDTLKNTLLKCATLVTPNIPEALLLAGMPVNNPDDMRKAGERILRLGAKAVLVKGGHLEGDTITNLLVTADGAKAFTVPRIATRSTHGTGCTLASAIAAGIAQGMAPEPAVQRAQEYVSAAIAAAPGFGHGHGPLKHNFMIKT